MMDEGGMVDQEEKKSSGPSLFEDIAPDREPGRRRRGQIKPPGYMILSKTAVVLIGGGMIVLVLWAFILGMLYGGGTFFKKQALKKYGPEAVAVTTGDAKGGTGQASTGQPSSDQTKSQAEAKPSKTGFITSMEESVKDWLDGGKSKKKAAPTPTTLTAPAPEPKPEPLVDPAPEPKPVAEPQSMPEPGPELKGGRYAIQIAATQNRADAERLVDKLKGEGIDAYYYHALVNGKSYYRIRVGNYETLNEARQESSNLKAKGHKGVFIWELKD